jgi:hypothetical protein
MGDRDLQIPQSMGRASDEAPGNETTSATFAPSGNDEEEASLSRPESPLPETPPSDSGAKPQAPTQKRRRVTRACDECRRKKIKCDGKQPCTHCTVYSYGESIPT